MTSIGTAIASREFTLENGNKVIAIIGMPQRMPDSEDYYCPFQIQGLGGGEVKDAPGVDSVQALIMAGSGGERRGHFWRGGGPMVQ